jgi:hypothetical protein
MKYIHSQFSGLADFITESDGGFGVGWQVLFVLFGVF